MDDVWVGEIYNTPLDSIEGDLWYYIEVCYKGIIYNKSALHGFVVLIEMSFQLL